LHNILALVEMIGDELIKTPRSISAGIFSRRVGAVYFTGLLKFGKMGEGIVLIKQLSGEWSC